METAKIITLGEIKIVGIETRTSNKSEMGGAGKIGELWQRFFREEIAQKIAHKTPGDVIYSLYSDYESDEHGEYSVTIGCEVTKTTPQPFGLAQKIIRPSVYAKITSERGPIPQIVEDAWKRVWAAKGNSPGGKRKFEGDFEVYDARSRDPQDAQIDLYIGLAD